MTFSARSLRLLRRGAPAARVAATLALAAGLGACDGVADAVTAITSPTTDTGTTSARLTVWTSDPSPSPIAVTVDGRSAGTLTGYYRSAPPCGTASTGAITIDVTPGSHTISAAETAASGRWAARSVSVSSGQCFMYELTP